MSTWHLCLARQTGLVQASSSPSACSPSDSQIPSQTNMSIDMNTVSNRHSSFLLLDGFYTRIKFYSHYHHGRKENCRNSVQYSHFSSPHKEISYLTFAVFCSRGSAHQLHAWNNKHWQKTERWCKTWWNLLKDSACPSDLGSGCSTSAAVGMWRVDCREMSWPTFFCFRVVDRWRRSHVKHSRLLNTPSSKSLIGAELSRTSKNSHQWLLVKRVGQQLKSWLSPPSCPWAGRHVASYELVWLFGGRCRLAVSRLQASCGYTCHTVCVHVHRHQDKWMTSLWARWKVC